MLVLSFIDSVFMGVIVLSGAAMGFIIEDFICLPKEEIFFGLVLSKTFDPVCSRLLFFVFELVEVAVLIGYLNEEEIGLDLIELVVLTAPPVFVEEV